MAAKAVGYDLTQTSGVATTYSYHQYGNLPSQTDALNRQTTYQYDTLGRKTSMTPPGGGATSYVYDALGNLKTVSEPLGRTTSYTFDTNGNKTSQTDANHQTTSYQYDGLNRLQQLTYPTTPATTMTYTYDFRNNVIDTTDQAGHVTHNVYDLAGRLIAASESRAPSNALKLCWYHAKVLGVTFFRYRRSVMNSAAVPLLAFSSLQVVDFKGA